MPITQNGGTLPLSGIVGGRFFSWYNGQVAINTVHWQVTSLGEGGRTYGQFAQWMDDTFRQLYITCLANDVLYLGTKAFQVNPNPLDAPGIFTANVIQAQGDLPVTTGVTGLIRFRTQRIGGRGRGRIYMPFIDREQVLSIGQISDALKTKYNALGAALATIYQPLLDGEQYRIVPVVYSTTYNDFHVITGVSAETLVATQRRRAARGELNPPVIS